MHSIGQLEYEADTISPTCFSVQAYGQINKNIWNREVGKY
jgi:hypothetical protein